ncbi:MAG: dephospho-CoA kinase [Alteromonadaceae bacterium]|nr:dephospho-CoA kinase [Alteromonadaceae bacterium]|tara:strand:+ start:11292 stop:11918 length:627 start_codon:yes stop_codon:yes gene_type:complete
MAVSAQSRPFLVGLTGGIGSGKTLVSDTFAQLGVDIVDADIIARDVVAPGSEGLSALVEHFGSGIVNASGELNRAALRERVFSNVEEKAWLNACLHPRIRRAMQQAAANVKSSYGILAVPLLIENDLTGMVDRVTVVDCPEDMQVARAMQRDGSSETIIRSIIASQATREQRLAVADDVIDNSLTPEHTCEQVKALHATYQALASQSN